MSPTPHSDVVSLISPPHNLVRPHKCPAVSHSEPMSTSRPARDHTEPTYTSAGNRKNATAVRPRGPHTRRIQAAPHPDVVAAAEFLLAEPDAYLYRRRYLELITHTSGPDGATITDYTAAEKYLLTTAATRRRAAHHATSPADDNRSDAPSE